MDLGQGDNIIQRERLARALGADIAEFFIVPVKNEPSPKPLLGGRRPTGVKRVRVQSN